jgi:spore germination cell wall hydrolase CwlJ-like protein
MSDAEDSAAALHAELEADTLARTIWGEARGEGAKGMEAVASVIMNRLRIARRAGSYWWGNSIIQICQKPFQFSCWNKDDPNYRQLLAVDGRDLVFATALRIARRAMAGVLADPTHGATHYHAAGMTPYWVGRHRPVAVIGRQIFYRIGD